MLPLYNAALWPFRLALPAWAWWRRRDPGGRTEWDERLVRRFPQLGPGAAWIHGASAGEARLVSALADAVARHRPALPLLVSATTPAGRRMLPAPPAVAAACFLPLDLPGLPARFLDAVRPAALALVETELWPNLLAAARARRLPVVVLNARLSPRRMRRYRGLSGLYRPALAGLARVGAQSAEDAARFIQLGTPAERVEITGNVKYDLPRPDVDPVELRRRFGLAAGRPVFVAGSTAPGEEEQVLEAFAAARRAAPELFLVLAPRHAA
ncbi:MAG TPA: glycosyltransferase N-terminal domain-containing protein, partial [Candidatus Polarisedimenticolaceae bacterium]|nr:glycosyltransferase N-terminal domain-containing protein [Candidatus Polarisedimenticolaceae bacterium]